MNKAICLAWIIISLFSNELLAQNAPITTAGTLSTIGPTTVISITAINFTNISSCNLELVYDSTIARATSITTGPLLGGNLSSNLSVPGKIVLGWYTYPAITLGGAPVLFNITFDKVDTGTTALTWFADGYSCIYYDGNEHALNDLPTSTYYINGTLTFLATVAPAVAAPVITGTKGENVNIPFPVTGFNDVGKFTLTLNYDPTVIIYQSFTGNAGYAGLSVDGSFPGILIASGLVSAGVSGITLPDSANLFTLNFKLYSIGTTPIVWSDTGISCEFYGPPPTYIPLSDIPKGRHYVDGSVTVNAPFGIPLPGEGANGNGDEHSLVLASSPNPFSEDVKLTWFLPETGQVLLEIRDLLGMKVSTLVDQVEQEGNHSMQVSSISLQPGIYIARITLRTNRDIMTRSVKMVKNSSME